MILKRLRGEDDALQRTRAKFKKLVAHEKRIKTNVTFVGVDKNVTMMTKIAGMIQHPVSMNHACLYSSSAAKS
jgi:hypothetical protein